MNNSRTQDLTEIFTSIIKMMLASIRAQGLRSLMHLPMLCRLAIELRRMGKEFAAVMAAYEAGTLSAPAAAPPAAPEPWTDPPDLQAEYAYSSEAPRPAARPDPAARDRQRPAERPSPPVADSGPDRPRPADGACSPATLPHARGQAAVRPWPPRRTPETRITVLGLPAGIIVTGRSP
jgi:hypothetical protein